MSIAGYRIERRLQVSRLWQFLSILIALALSIATCALLLISADADLGKAVSGMWSGAFGSWRALVGTLIKATPLILTGLAVVVAFRARIWNIGAEGQLFAGAIVGYWAYTMASGLPAPLLFVVVIAASFVGGGLYGGLAGFLKARLSVNEVLSTVMLNYVIRFFLSYMLVEGGWRDQSTFYQQSPQVIDAAKFPLLLDGMRLHAGFIIALVAVVVVYIVLFKTSFGYAIRAIGNNARAARFKGINIQRTTILVMCLSGGLAGLAGAGELFGLQFRLKPELSHGFGFTGIIIAVISGLNPIGVVITSVLFGGLMNGGLKLQILTGVPTALVSAIQGIVLIYFLVAACLTRYQLRKVSTDG